MCPLVSSTWVDALIEAPQQVGHGNAKDFANPKEGGHT
jgi:hypothetical protein